MSAVQNRRMLAMAKLLPESARPYLNLDGKRDLAAYVAAHERMVAALAADRQRDGKSDGSAGVSAVQRELRDTAFAPGSPPAAVTAAMAALCMAGSLRSTLIRLVSASPAPLDPAGHARLLDCAAIAIHTSWMERPSETARTIDSEDLRFFVERLIGKWSAHLQVPLRAEGKGDTTSAPLTRGSAATLKKSEAAHIAEYVHGLAAATVPGARPDPLRPLLERMLKGIYRPGFFVPPSSWPAPEPDAAGPREPVAAGLPEVEMFVTPAARALLAGEIPGHGALSSTGARRRDADATASGATRPAAMPVPGSLPRPADSVKFCSYQ